MKNFVIVLVDGKRKYFQADSWYTTREGHLVFKRGTNSDVLVIAADKWVWFSPEAEDEPTYRLVSEKPS